jgi:uncharacterized membrane protein
MDAATLKALEGAAGLKFAGGNLGTIISAALPYVFTVAGVLLLIYLLLGGLGYMTSRGEPKAVEEAKNKITYALIGFVVIFVAYWIVQIVGTVLGTKAITNIFK